MILMYICFISGSSGDELEVSGVTTGEEEDLESVDSNPLSPHNQDTLEIIPVVNDNVEHVHRRKKTPHQLYQMPHESDHESDRNRMSPRNVSSPDDSSRYSFESKRKSVEERGLRIKSTEALLKNHDDGKLKNELVVPSELLVRTRRDRDGREGVWARTSIARGVRYGPFAGKWASLPADSKYAWEVSRFFFLELYFGPCKLA